MSDRRRTAYPVFKEYVTADELSEFYTPTDDELNFIKQNAKGDVARLSLAILLKAFQKLGYLPQVASVPVEVVKYIGAILKVFYHLPLPKAAHRSRVRYRRAIHDFLDIKSYGQGGQQVVESAIKKAALTMSHPADLINVAIEQLILNRYELPRFRTLDDLAAHIRHQTHLDLYAQVTANLSEAHIASLDGLLEKKSEELRYPLTRLKALPNSASLTMLIAWDKHLTWLESICDPLPHVSILAHTKMVQFADEVYPLEISDVRGIHSDNRRRTLLLCLLHQMQVRTRDQLIEMYQKQIRSMHHSGKRRLTALRDTYQGMTEELTNTFSEIVNVAADADTPNSSDSDQDVKDTVLGKQVRTILAERGGVKHFQSNYSLLSAIHNNNYFPLMQTYHYRNRGSFFRVTRHLDIQAVEPGSTLLAALLFVHKTQYTSDPLDDEINLDFASQKWRSLIRQKIGGELKINKDYLQACVFTAVADGLRNGDLFVVGSEQFADFRTQLLSWSECQASLTDYCKAIEIPNDPEGFIDALQERLTKLAKKTDAAQIADSDLYFDKDGKPHLRRLASSVAPKNADAMHDELKARMPVRHLLDIMHHAHCWVPYTRHFGPPSGSDPKLKDPIDRYLMTIFAYGSNIGPVQAARHIKGAITARVLGRINTQHISTDKLDSAVADLVNEYKRFRLPLYWGKPNVAVADGTHHKLYDNNLMGERHIRYGAYGGIAYHHISDTYVALFSHFIACGVWEAVYILDGLLKNKSALQPDTIHSDTQGQSEVVFGLAHLLGIKLMPRMRNWNKVTMYRPSKDVHYKHIDGWFTRTINWELLRASWKELMQVVLSIHSGKVLPSWLLQKLVSDNPKNKLYLALKELGCVIRTLFLLEYASDAPLRAQIQATTTKIESYNAFSEWIFFGDDGLIRSRDPIEYEKRIKYKDLIANIIMLHNVFDMTAALYDMTQDRLPLTSDIVATFSPYMNEHIKRLGEYVIDTSSQPPPLEPDLVFLNEDN